MDENIENIENIENMENTESMDEIIPDVEKLLESLNDKTTVKFFSNKKYVGIDVGVIRKGWGWGHVILSHNIEENTWHLEDEYTSRTTVENFLHAAIPIILDKLYDKGHIKIENTKEDSVSLIIKAKSTE